VSEKQAAHAVPTQEPAPDENLGEVVVTKC
jgi:hypothetical protein